MNEDILKNIVHENKIRRRNALTKFQNVVSSNTLTLEEYEIYEIAITTCLTDVSEINRSKACKILVTILEKGLKPKHMPTLVVPTLHHRLSSVPLVEECEENRLEFLNLIEIMIDIFKDDMKLHLNALCNILVTSLQDKFPEVILKACDCIIKLPSITDCKFQMFSNSFTKYLIQCIAKNRLKVRLKTLNVLECICTHGDILEFDEANVVLLKCINDVPQVRLALLSLGYIFCSKMRERYTYYPKILPFVLFGLRDNDEEIQRTAKVFWEKVGAQYASENDLGSVCAPNTNFEIKATEVRSLDFSIGCCELIRRNFHRILEDLKNGVENWLEDVRLNYVRLLTLCLLGLRENCLQYSPKILDILHFSANDNDSRIVDECLVCGEVLGQFLPPDLYIPYLEHSFWEEGNEGCLRIFSCLVKTTPLQQLQIHLPLFIKLLRFSNISSKLSIWKQKIIMDVFMKLFTCKFEKFEADLFFTLFYIIESKISIEEDKEEAFEVLRCASNCHESYSVNSFLSDYMRECLMKLNTSMRWIEEDDPSFRVFLFLSNFKGFEIEYETVSVILKTKIEYNTAPLVAFAALQGMTDVLQRVASNEDEKLLQVWSTFLLKDLIFKMLKCHRGRTGESLRLASISSMVSIVGHSGAENRFIYEAIEECTSYLEGLISEDFIETRILSCSFIEVYVENYSTFLEPASFFNLMQMLIKRLDDVNQKVRRLASWNLVNCLRIYSRAVESSEKVIGIVKSVAIFLKDDDVHVKQNILALLEVLRTVRPEEVEEVLRSDEHGDISKQIQNINLLQAHEEI